MFDASLMFHGGWLMGNNGQCVALLWQRLPMMVAVEKSGQPMSLFQTLNPGKAKNLCLNTIVGGKKPPLRVLLVLLLLLSYSTATTPTTTLAVAATATCATSATAATTATVATTSATSRSTTRSSTTTKKKTRPIPNQQAKTSTNLFVIHNFKDKPFKNTKHGSNETTFKSDNRNNNSNKRRTNKFKHHLYDQSLFNILILTQNWSFPAGPSVATRIHRRPQRPHIPVRHQTHHVKGHGFTSESQKGYEFLIVINSG